MTDSTDDGKVHISTKKGPEVAAVVAKLFSTTIGGSDDSHNGFSVVKGSKRDNEADFTSPSDPVSAQPHLVVIDGGVAGKRQEVEDDDFVAF